MTSAYSSNRKGPALFNIPEHGDVLVDSLGLPRYWSIVWTIFHGGGLAPSTLQLKLRYIESIYRHTEAAGGDLDDAVSNLDFEVLDAVLSAFFVTLRNVPNPANTAIDRWNVAFGFVKDICERLERNPGAANQMEDIRAHMNRLDRLYLGLRPYKKRYKAQIRAIPKPVVLELIDAVTPGSPTNPFEYEATQWRVFAIFSLMLMQGLRQGEMLLLPANFYRCEIDTRTGRERWYMSVKTNESEDDKRYSKPSIKTLQSIRTIPMTSQTATGLMTYADNYRGKVNHVFFLSSMHSKALSKEGVAKAMQKLTLALTPAARAQLLDLTGAKNVTAQALRHTCAVVRLKQWYAQGKTPEQAMAKMRSFFGWSKSSLMPLHYAKAALDERLSESWNETLDIRLNFLRELPQ